MSAEMPKIPEPVYIFWSADTLHIRLWTADPERAARFAADTGATATVYVPKQEVQEAARQAMERFDQFKRVADISEIALHEQNNDLMRQIVGLRSALDIAQRYVALQKAPWSPMVQAEDLNTVNRALLPQSEKRHG